MRPRRGLRQPQDAPLFLALNAGFRDRGRRKWEVFTGLPRRVMPRDPREFCYHKVMMMMMMM